MKKLVFVLCLSILAMTAYAARTSVEIKADIAKARQALVEAKAVNGDVSLAKKELVALRKELHALTRVERADRLDDGGETCDNATEVTSLPYGDSGVISEETEDNYEYAGCGLEGSELVYVFTVGEGGLPAGSYTLTTCGSDFDTVIELWTACPGSDDAELVDCNDDMEDEDECGDDNDGLSSCIPDVFLSEGTYYVTVAGYSFDTGDYVLTIGVDIDCGGQGAGCPASAPNAYCTGAEFLTLDGGSVQVLASSTLGGSWDGLPYCGTDPEACGLWYEVVGTGNRMLAHTCDHQTNYDTKINIYTGSCDDLICVGGNDDWFVNDEAICDIYSLASGVEWCSVEGETYYIFVNGYDGDVGRFNLTVEDSESPCCEQRDYYFTLEQIPFCQCLTICTGQIQKIFVGPATEAQRPVANWADGCMDNRNIPGGCASDCYPAYPELYMDWIYLPDRELWCMDLYSEQGGCYCFCVDRVLPVELNNFSAVAGDGQVTLSWSTASESNANRFEITRNGVTLAQIEAANSATGATYNWVDETADNGTTYSYSLVLVNLDGSRDELETESATPMLGNGVVSEYSLLQNYPNPFNPETNISFTLPEIANVELRVFNALGQEVAVLANGTYGAGVHTVQFSGSNLTSGIYFYTIKAGSFSAQHKMLLLK